MTQLQQIRQEIERRIKLCNAAPVCSIRAEVNKELLAFLDTLEQQEKDVDLEKITKYPLLKELPEGFDKDWLKFYHTDNVYNSAEFHHLSTLEREYRIARHFYELGKM